MTTVLISYQQQPLQMDVQALFTAHTCNPMGPKAKNVTIAHITF